MKEGHKISNKAAAILLVSAIIADILTLIPFVGIAVGPLFWIVVNYYFWKVGLGIINGKRATTSVISMVGEVIPAIQMLPTITLGIAIIILTGRFEEKTGVKLPLSKAGPKANVGGVRQPPPRIPLHKDGLRPPNGGLPA